MPRSSRDEIVKDFVAELQSYIPTLVRNIETLKKDPEHKDAFEELHRLVHTIKGAASLVGIAGLSHMALPMEEALDDITTGALEFTDELFDAMAQTVCGFETYAGRLLADGMDQQALVEKAVTYFRRLRNLSLNSDPENASREAGQPNGNIQPSREEGADDIGADDFPVTMDDIPAIDLTGETISLSANGLEDFDTLAVCGNLNDPSDAPEAAIGMEGTVGALENGNERSWDLPQDELLASFYQEAEEHLQDLGRALIVLESQVPDAIATSASHRECIRQIRRAVHTIKGAAAVIGRPEISAWAHAVEDLLDWLHEEASEVTPVIIATLAESSDLLEQFVTDPQTVDHQRVSILKRSFDQIMGPRSAARNDNVPAFKRDAENEESFSEMPAESEKEFLETLLEGSKTDAASLSASHAKTLRVGLDRVDALVNLAGEMNIAFSALERKMGVMLESIGDLERSCDRLRKTAHDLEVGYEVKAIQHPGSAHRIPPAASSLSDSVAADLADFDLLELDRYSEFNLIIRSLNEAVLDVGAVHNRLTNFYNDFDSHLNEQRVLVSELQDKIMRVRMTPMTMITNRLHRTVRETAAKLGKKARLVIKGEEIELDRMVWEKLSDPLMHLLRNAVDHGIEFPVQREVKAKPAVGTVKVIASYEGNQVAIRISDDGAGLDYEAIRKTALHRNLVGKPDARSEDELAALIFQPGLSSRRDVSEISGRGVGLDVVKENIAALQGTIRVSTFPEDQGVQFCLRIPLTLAVIRALLFTVNGRTYALALNQIKEIMRIPSENIIHAKHKAVRIDAEIIPLHYLSEALSSCGQSGDVPATAENPLTLVVETGEWRGAVVIDALNAQREIVIKNLGSHLASVKGIAGATIMGDGKVVPILNVDELFGSDGVGREGVVAETRSIVEKPLEILVVDDSVSIRQVVVGLLRRQGWQTRTARDGIEALEKVDESQPDLILLDVEMPKMNGYEFMRALQARPASRKIPIVMLTSRTAPKHRQKAATLGAKGFIVKPYENEKLIALIQHVIGVAGK
ncbi:MAG: response regulator [Desulfobacterales bacterium]|nr:MAG: response regulator [Desulfobacterales bacterium]